MEYCDQYIWKREHPGLCMDVHNVAARPSSVGAYRKRRETTVQLPRVFAHIGTRYELPVNLHLNPVIRRVEERGLVEVVLIGLVWIPAHCNKFSTYIL